jgi:hypothetical protein
MPIRRIPLTATTRVRGPATSDGSGNSLAESGGLASAGSITPSPELASGTAALFVADSSFDGGLALTTEALGGDSGGSLAVPEPSTLVLVAIACLGGLLVDSSSNRIAQVVELQI